MRLREAHRCTYASDARGQEIASVCKMFEESVLPALDLKQFRFSNGARFVSAIFNVTTFTEDAIRCERLGQSVLNLCIADYLFAHFPNLTFDQLATTQLQFSKRHNICEIAKQVKLPAVLQSVQGNAHVNKRDVDDFLYFAFLRLVGALYVDGGLHLVREFVVKHVLQRSIDISYMLESFDPQRELLGLISGGRLKGLESQHVEYVMIGGDEEMDFFVVQAAVGKTVLGEGKGPTLKLAQMKAAQDALNRYYSVYVKCLTPIQKEQAQLPAATTTTTAAAAAETKKKKKGNAVQRQH